MFPFLVDDNVRIQNILNNIIENLEISKYPKEYIQQFKELSEYHWNKARQTYISAILSQTILGSDLAWKIVNC